MKRNVFYIEGLKRRRRFCMLLIFCILLSPLSPCMPSPISAASQLPTDLTELSIEDLMNVEITSAAKKRQRLSEAAAAIFVITQEDIRRSGATSIPEALRMVPGIQVAKIDANKWAITSRGFNGRFANKLLVLMDGRSVYTPLYSGVFWEVQDTVLEDIDRIEVIRGPGASLWGANAVNGVINIITKSATETQGGLAVAGGGDEEKGFGTLRYGGKIGENSYYRIYSKYFDRDSGVDSLGNDTADDWDFLRGGFRFDHGDNDSDSFTLQGDVYDGTTGDTITAYSLLPPFSTTFDEENDFQGFNAMGRWKHRISDTSDLALQVYFDRAEWETAIAGVIVDTYDIDFQHRFAWGSRQEIIWGLGYRYIRDDVDGGFSLTADPDNRSTSLYSAFIQDEIQLDGERLRLTVGSKFEHNDYTDYEIQPNARIMWQPRERHSIWASASRAVRTPSRGENDARFNAPVFPPNALFPGSPLTVVALIGNSDFESEELIAYEMGYRVQPQQRLSLDFALFYNEYDNLRSIEGQPQFFELIPPPPHAVIPTSIDNKLSGYAYGVELAADWLLFDWWRWQAGYTFLRMELDPDTDSTDTVTEPDEDKSPRHQVSLRSSMELPRDVELDFWFRFVDELPALKINSYTTLDIRLAWSPVPDFEIALVGQNLLDDQHAEFESERNDTKSTEVERGVYGKITWRF